MIVDRTYFIWPKDTAPTSTNFLIRDALIVSDQKWEILHLYTTGLGGLVKAVSSLEKCHTASV